MHLCILILQRTHSEDAKQRPPKPVPPKLPHPKPVPVKSHKPVSIPDSHLKQENFPSQNVIFKLSLKVLSIIFIPSYNSLLSLYHK